jgi:hypothetical protein
MPESTPRLPSLSSALWVQPNLTASFISLCSVGDDMNLSARHLMLTWFFSYGLAHHSLAARPTNRS